VRLSGGLAEMSQGEHGDLAHAVKVAGLATLTGF